MILRVMMPILPLVRVPNVDEAIDFAVEVEHGNRHTAMMHSKNVDKLTKMAKITSAAIVEISGWGYFYYSYKNDAGLKRYFLNIMLPSQFFH